MKVAVAPRTAAAHSQCDCCERYRRCAWIWVDALGNVSVCHVMRPCSGCLRAGWDAAREVRR